MRFLVAFIFGTSFALAHQNDGEQIFHRFFDGPSGWESHLHADFESRYSSEGRDALDGDGLASTTFEAAWNAVTVGLWYGRSPDQAYDELQLSSALSWEWKSLEWYVAYTHLRFPQDGGHDHEIGIGSAWTGLPWEFAVALDAYHSLGADGTFIEASLRREFGVSERLRLTPAIVFGLNQGYVADGHDGANHIALNFGGEYSLTDSLTLAAHVSQSFAIGRDAGRYSGDGLLRDFFHFAIGFRYEF